MKVFCFKKWQQFEKKYLVEIFYHFLHIKRRVKGNLFVLSPLNPCFLRTILFNFSLIVQQFISINTQDTVSASEDHQSKFWNTIIEQIHEKPNGDSLIDFNQVESIIVKSLTKISQMIKGRNQEKK
jgi:hypothetical protein